MPEIAIGWRFSSEKKLGPWDKMDFTMVFLSEKVGDELLGSGCC